MFICMCFRASPETASDCISALVTENSPQKRIWMRLRKGFELRSDYRRVALQYSF